MSKGRAIVAMSGGVDSSVAASIVADEGYEVSGLSMHLHSCARGGDRSCCSARDRMDAREVCKAIGITLDVVDMRERFREEVVEPFVDDYLDGRTPSPCIRCNEFIKFPVLLEQAIKTGAERIATGHYARVVRDGGIARLFAASDREKDQSYFLFGLTQDALSNLEFPVGTMTKDEVRAHARERSLPVHEKAESQEICFVPEDDYAGFLESVSPERLGGPGDFLSLDGKKLGTHRGIHAYTIGQRRGLNLGGGPRRYVVRIDKGDNAVVLGDDHDLMQGEMIVGGVNWIHPSFAHLSEATVRIRSTHVGEDAELEALDGGRVRIGFSNDVRAIARGQAAVFYDGDEVLGGGWIE